MDINAYKLFQQSEWIRRQADSLAAGEPAVCPVDGCGGALERYEVERPEGDPRVDAPVAGGVACRECRARSRPVAL